MSQQQKTVKSLNIEYKRKVLSDLSKEAKDLENNAATAVDEMGKVLKRITYLFQICAQIKIPMT